MKASVLLLAVVFVVVSCAASRAEVQLATITAGCKVSLDLERDAGAAGAEDETAEGCRAAIRTWEVAK